MDVVRTDYLLVDGLRLVMSANNVGIMWMRLTVEMKKLNAIRELKKSKRQLLEQIKRLKRRSDRLQTEGEKLRYLIVGVLKILFFLPLMCLIAPIVLIETILDIGGMNYQHLSNRLLNWYIDV